MNIKLNKKQFEELESFFSKETLNSISMGKIIGGKGTNKVKGCDCIHIENATCPTNNKDRCNNTYALKADLLPIKIKIHSSLIKEETCKRSNMYVACGGCIIKNNRC